MNKVCCQMQHKFLSGIIPLSSGRNIQQHLSFILDFLFLICIILVICSFQGICSRNWWF